MTNGNNRIVGHCQQAEMEPISREEAKSKGLKHFYTGVRCKRGHIDVRFVSDRGCVSCRRETSLKWRDENIDRAREIDRAAAKRRQPARTEYAKKYSKENREKFRLKERIDKQKRRANGRLKKTDVISILALQKWLCAEPTCKADLRIAYHLDHIMPVALGGKTERKNCQALCPACNMTKSAKHPIDFARERGRLL